MAPLILCPGGYHQLTDEAGNASTAGLLAMDRIARSTDVSTFGAEWLAIFHGLQWGDDLYRRLHPCPRPCDGCEAARAAARLLEV